MRTPPLKYLFLEGVVMRGTPLSEDAYSISGFSGLNQSHYSVNRATIARSSRIGVHPTEPTLPFRYQSAKDIYALIKDLSMDFPTSPPEEIVKRAIDVSLYDASEVSVEDQKLLVMSVEFLQNGFAPDINKSPMTTRRGRGLADWHGAG